MLSLLMLNGSENRSPTGMPSDVIGYINMTFRMFNVLNVWYNLVAPNPPAPYYVLDTDYENWASVFSCSEARPEGSCYILARSPKIDVELVILKQF